MQQQVEHREDHRDDQVDRDRREDAVDSQRPVAKYEPQDAEGEQRQQRQCRHDFHRATEPMPFDGQWRQRERRAGKGDQPDAEYDAATAAPVRVGPERHQHRVQQEELQQRLDHPAVLHQWRNQHPRTDEDRQLQEAPFPSQKGALPGQRKMPRSRMVPLPMGRPTAIQRLQESVLVTPRPRVRGPACVRPARYREPP